MFIKGLLAAVTLLIAITTQGCTARRSTARKTEGTRSPATFNTNTARALGASGECDPNYSGCVPIASDVDCAGGKGNGPAYVKGPVRVIGKDIYGLDKDRDGIGCE
ncbi:MAG TPA: hypothetical protein VGD61_20765 [Pyrinomonadaceae bacterium]